MVPMVDMYRRARFTPSVTNCVYIYSTDRPFLLGEFLIISRARTLHSSSLLPIGTQPLELPRTSFCISSRPYSLVVPLY